MEPKENYTKRHFMLAVTRTVACVEREILWQYRRKLSKSARKQDAQAVNRAYSYHQSYRNQVRNPIFYFVLKSKCDKEKYCFRSNYFLHVEFQCSVYPRYYIKTKNEAFSDLVYL